LLYHILPKRSRHSDPCKVIVIAMQDHNAVTVMKKIQNWYKFRTFPLYVGTVAIRMMSSLEHDMWQNVFKRHWHVRGMSVPFIWTDNKWKTSELSVWDKINYILTNTSEQKIMVILLVPYLSILLQHQSDYDRLYVRYHYWWLSSNNRWDLIDWSIYLFDGHMTSYIEKSAAEEVELNLFTCLKILNINRNLILILVNISTFYYF